MRYPLLLGRIIYPYWNRDHIDAFPALEDQKFKFGLKTKVFPFGGKHYLETGRLVDEADEAELRRFDAIYLGAIGLSGAGAKNVAPGILEMMVNNVPLMTAHPEIGRAFEEYTRLRMQTMGPILPDGYGLMRVVPVESAIEGLPGVSPYEKLSYYLEK